MTKKKHILKKIMIISSISLSLIFIILFIILSTEYKPEDHDIKINENYMKYFHEDYESARNEFIKKASLIADKFPGTEISSYKIPSKNDGSLTMDWCYVPSEKPECLLILSSAVHGIEGYTGNAMIGLFIREYLLKDKVDKNTGVLMITGINAYGMKYYLRSTENNIDLNRNCTTDLSLYAQKNEAYSKFARYFQSKGKVSMNRLDNFSFSIRMLYSILKYSKKDFLEALTLGQYEYEDGLFYGGKKMEPQIMRIEEMLKKYLPAYKYAVHYDFHTGYGTRGYMHLFGSTDQPNYIRKKIEELFAYRKVDWADENTGNFYEPVGDITDWISEMVKRDLPNIAMYIPMSIEYGTLDGQSIGGGILSVKSMVKRNQGIHYGYKSDKDRMKVETLNREHFNPSSKRWRTGITAQTAELFDNTLPLIPTLF